MLELRPKTNLNPPDELSLNEDDLDQGFMHFYSAFGKDNPAVTLFRTWAGVIYPDLVNHRLFGTQRAGLGKMIEKIQKGMPSGLLELKRVNGATEEESHILASFPIFKSSSYAGFASQLESVLMDSYGRKIESIRNDFRNTGITGREFMTRMRQEEENQGAKTYKMHYSKAELLAAATSVSQETRTAIEQAVEGLEIRNYGTATIAYLVMKIETFEAEQLTSTPWTQIRNVDIYPVLMQWVDLYYGGLGLPPLTSFPISKIVDTMPKSDKIQPRTNDRGLAISPKGDLVYIPPQLDASKKFEQKFNDSSANANNYAMVNVEEMLSQHSFGKQYHNHKLPINMPVFVDWLNYKFAYTNSGGVLNVLDVSRYRPANTTHLVRFLNEPVPEDFGEIVQKFGDILGNHLSFPEGIEKNPNGIPGITPAGQAVAWPRLKTFSPVEYLDFIRKAYDNSEADSDIMRLKTLAPNSKYQAIQVFGIYVRSVYYSILENLEAVYQKYSVTFVSEHLPLLALVAEYSLDYDQLHAEDQKRRDAYLNQGIDENYEEPALPLVSDTLGRLPHQKKLANLLRARPEFAILPVQAGGGKTPVIIMDILEFIRANIGQPFLILCPSHLVAQYVKEVAHFTSGQLNVIALNTYTLNTNSMERMTKLIQTAPRNSVVVADYDVLKYQEQEVMYGTTTTRIFPVIELLRQFGFGYVACDESHYIKNQSARSAAALSLLVDIPYKRLASGTMSHDSPTDLAIQISVFDPTVFGSRDKFNKTYGEEIRGDRVVKWRPGYEHLIQKKLKENVVVAGANRKEWVGLLPFFKENIHVVGMTDNQKAAYQEILTQIVEQIRVDAAKNKLLQKFLEGPKAESKTDEESADSSEAAKEEFSAAMEALLRPYLARLEQFVTAPAKDKYGDGVLVTPEDRTSPKVLKIIDICQDHIATNVPGKILIFTNYVESAEEIYESLPNDLKKKFILYTAAQKIESGSKFEKDDNIIGMVGVEQSMNTGLNLQFCSRLIRVETVWNPGTLEQGNARVGRPQLKKRDTRDFVYYDWVVADNSIDVTKMARLTSKIVEVAKFDNPDNPEYSEINSLDVISMTLDNVLEFNNREQLRDYVLAYSRYKTIQNQEFNAYRKEHGVPVLEPVPKAKPPKDAALMRYVPYTPGLEIYGADELGLVRVDEYLNSREDDSNADDDSKAATRALMKDKLVHTEFGDGRIKSISKSTITVMLTQGYKVSLKPSAVFLVTRAQTSMKDVKNAILKSIGSLPMDTPIDVPLPESFKVLPEKQKENQESLVPTKPIKKPKVLTAELSLTVVNGFLAIKFFVEDDEVGDVTRTLEALGFKLNPEHYFTYIDDYNQYMKQLKLWKDNGFTIDKSVKVVPALESTRDMLKNGGFKSGAMAYQFAQQANLVSFDREEHKPNGKKNVIKPYPIIDDGEVLLALPLQGQAGTREAIKFKAPRVRWVKSSPSISYYGLQPERISKMMHAIMGAGVTILNIADLRKEFKKLIKMKTRTEGPMDNLQASVTVKAHLEF